MRLFTYLQTTHHLPRRKIVELIQQGKILINGQKVASFKHELSPKDEITLPDGNISLFSPTDTLTTQQQNSHKLLLFNKPKGYVVSKSDTHTPTIYKILPKEFQHYYYIGRLDKESRGLVLLTNSPDLVHRYEHPKFNITKEYLIQLSSPISSQHLQQITKI
jgi:23S rRNA pseudouridine2605 synthase